MTSFDKREKAFEQQFAQDEELRFKATARRNIALALKLAIFAALMFAGTLLVGILVRYG